MSKEVYLFGASGHGKVIKDTALSIAFKVVGFVDDNPKNNFLHNTPVFKTEDIKDFCNKDFVISIGNNAIRKEKSKKLNVKFTTLIDEDAKVSEFSKIGIGTVVMSSAIINADVTIGDHVIINTASVIEHDCVISDYVHVSPNATITGGVTIGEGTHIGAGAIVIPGIKIGKWVTVGAGSVIINDIPNHTTVVGNPGRIIK